MLKLNLILCLLLFLVSLAMTNSIAYATEAYWSILIVTAFVNVSVFAERIYARFVKFKLFSDATVAVNEAFFLCLQKSLDGDLLPLQTKLDARDILREGVLPVQKYTQRNLVELVEYADARIEDIRSAATYFTQLLSEIREAKNE